MKAWLVLAAAICCEVAGSMALAQAEHAPAWMLLTLVADGIALFLLTRLLRGGMPLSVAYGIWGAGGVSVTAVASALVLGESFTPLMGVGIVLVIAGVLLVEFGAAPEKHIEHEEPMERVRSRRGREVAS